jgi:hypothetical protein
VTGLFRIGGGTEIDEIALGSTGPASLQAKLWRGATEAKRRVMAVYIAKGATADKDAVVKCWSCKATWLPRSGGHTVLATRDGAWLGFGACLACYKDRPLLERVAAEAFAADWSPTWLPAELVNDASVVPVPVQVELRRAPGQKRGTMVPFRSLKGAGR